MNPWYKELIQDIKDKHSLQLWLTFILILLVIYIIRPLLSIILLTVIFAYLSISSTRVIKKYLKIPSWIIITVLYFLIIGIVVVLFALGIPRIITQIQKLYIIIEKFILNPPNFSFNFGRFHHYFSTKDIKSLSSQFVNSREVQQQVSGFAKKTIDLIGHTGKAFYNILISAFLSYVLAISWKNFCHFGQNFLKSRYHRFFKNISELCGLYINTLGSVIKVQIIIDLINTFLMAIGLHVLNMPSLLVLILMVLILGFIPIAGVLISLIPLSLVALASGGFIRLGEVLILILVIHTFETYLLNPRLMSNRLNLPIFVSFITLIIAEHFWGAWGLIVGLPTLVFFLELLDVKGQKLDDNSKKLIKK